VPIKAQSPGFCNTNPELCDIVRTGNSFSQQNPNHLEPFVPRIGLKNPTSDDCRYQNITTMCVTWETKSDVERAEEKGDATNGDLPYKYTGGFRIEWSVERNFPPPNEEDKNARINQVMKNFEFFGAPCAFFCFVDGQMGPPQWSDLGMFLQTFMLLAKEAGLDTCAQEAWSIKQESVSQFVKASDEDILFCGMSIGYKDPDAIINSLASERRPIDTWATFL
jgi:hypothetical protein